MRYLISSTNIYACLEIRNIEIRRFEMDQILEDKTTERPKGRMVFEHKLSRKT
jgi:hypothetical protein